MYILISPWSELWSHARLLSTQQPHVLKSAEQHQSRPNKQWVRLTVTVKTAAQLLFVCFFQAQLPKSLPKQKPVQLLPLQALPHPQPKLNRKTLAALRPQKSKIRPKKVLTPSRKPMKSEVKPNLTPSAGRWWLWWLPPVSAVVAMAVLRVSIKMSGRMRVAEGRWS